MQTPSSPNAVRLALATSRHVIVGLARGLVGLCVCGLALGCNGGAGSHDDDGADGGEGTDGSSGPASDDGGETGTGGGPSTGGSEDGDADDCLDDCSWRAYPYQSGDLTFPEAEGDFPDLGYGWWYLSMFLDDEEGQRTVLMTSFLNEFALLGSIDDPAEDFHHNQRLIGTITAATGKLDVRFDYPDAPTNYLTQVPDEPFYYDLFYTIEGYELDLRLESRKPPYALGETGFVQQLANTWSYYYAQPRLAVSGTMQRASGDTTTVSGIAWLDRQWYPTSDAETLWGHFWVAIHLDDGTDIAAYRTIAEGGEVPFPLLDIMSADGSYAHYEVDAIEPLELFETPVCGLPPLQRAYSFPLGAVLSHPETGTDLTLSIATDDPLAAVLDGGDQGCLLEAAFSVEGVHGGQTVAGDAFVEVSISGAEF